MEGSGTGAIPSAWNVAVAAGSLNARPWAAKYPEPNATPHLATTFSKSAANAAGTVEAPTPLMSLQELRLLRLTERVVGTPLVISVEPAATLTSGAYGKGGWLRIPEVPAGPCENETDAVG